MSAGLPVSYQPAGPITNRLTWWLNPRDPSWAPDHTSDVKPLHLAQGECHAPTGRTTETSERRRAA